MKKIILLLAFGIQSIVSQAQLSFDYRLLIDFPSVNTNKFKLIDLDSDGDLDVFTGAYFLLNEKGSYVLDSINVFEQNPDPVHNYLPYTYLISRGLYTILDIEDSNGDGIFEMFILNIKQKRIEVKVNYKKTNEFFDSGLSFLNYDKLVFFDADNDGYKDFVLGNEDGIVIYQNSILFNRELISIYSYEYFGSSKQTGTGELIVYDFNKDGELDIFNGSVFFYKKPFKSDFVVSGTLQYQNTPFSIRNIQVADVTNSAFPSLMGDIDFNKSKIPFSSFILNQTDSAFQNYKAQNAADLDNDGLLDYIFVENNILKYKTKNRTFNFNQSATIQIDAIKYIGDIDQNGFLDIIATSKTEIYLLSQKNVLENAAPIAPKLNTTLNGNILEISWVAGKDDKTPVGLLQYNLTISATDQIGLAPFPVLSSTISNKQTKPMYTQESSFKANVGYVLSKNIALNYEVEEITINISAIDNKGRISTPAFSTLTYNFHPFELSVDSNALGNNNTPFELSVADMDADGSLDFLVQKSNIQDSLKCYFKNAASWKSSNAKFAKTQSNSQIADFSNSGNLDLVLENTAKLLEKGTFNVSKDAFETSPITNLSTAKAFKYVFDADSDGDLDLFVSNDSLDHLSTFHFLIYNKAGQFESPKATDKLVLHSSDFNDDGENDQLILKKIKNGYSISLLSKRDTSYFETQTNLYKLSGNTKHLSSIQIERYDVNGDGIFELVIHEKEASVCAILERNFLGGFSQIKLFINSNFVFVDYDNDGLIDLFELNSATIYHNEDDFDFTANRYIPTLAANILLDYSGAKNNYKPTIAVDFDHDSLTDFVSVDDAGLMFFKNNLSVDKNKAPSIPSKLKAETFEDSASLTWQKSVDKDSVGLFYNIQLWKKETNQFLTPVHSLADGRLLLNEKYTSISNKHVFRHLTDGTYYWKVQAIDAGNLPSEFSEVGSFEVVIKPTISGNQTACNHDIDTFSVSPKSEHYTWQVSGGTIIDSSSENIKVKWGQSGFQQVKITNTKFQLFDSTTIEVKNNPIPSINYHFPDSNSVLKLLFKTNYSDSIETYNWNINNSIYSEATPTHLFSLPGKYAAKVEVKYKNGCKIHEEKSIYLFYPKIEGKKAVCGTSEETYTANPKGPEYKWEVVGGLILSTSNESIKVKWEESNQAKSVTLTNPTYQYADSINVNVFPVPMADFEVPENIGIGSLIQFQNTSTGAISTYSWDFDEPENTSVEKNPVTSFSVQGQHKIYLSAISNVGCVANSTKVVIVSDKVSNLIIANLITPNSDGKNDLLYIENLERYPENEVKLYTAWGAEIFSQANYQNDWDLRKSDEYIPSGNYLCVVELKKFGKRFEKIVTVTR